MMSCRGGDEESAESSYPLVVHDLGTNTTREARIGPIECLQWRPDGREISAVVRRQRGWDVVTLDADDLATIRKSALPIEPPAERIEISCDPDHVSFSSFESHDDSSEEDEFSAYVHDLATGQTIKVGHQVIDTEAAWSPVESKLAFRGYSGEGADLHKVMAIFDFRTRETTMIAAVNSGDASGEITGPAPVWSADGKLLAFASYEEEGSAIYVVEVSTGVVEKILQTDGLIHSLGFVGLSTRAE
jgi:dipeptidyl aminopeptidase/acylaminoacyl peptidase